MPRRISGRHPLTIQPLVEKRELILIRIQASQHTQEPVEYLEAQDELDLSFANASVLKSYVGRPPLGRTVRMEVFDVVATAHDTDVRSFLEQPDQSELWMIAETIRRQLANDDRDKPFLIDYPNIFLLGSHALVCSWLMKRKLFRLELEERAALVYPPGSRILRPATDVF